MRSEPGAGHAEIINITGWAVRRVIVMTPSHLTPSQRPLTINYRRLEVFPVTAVKVTLPTRGPEESDQAIDHPLLDELVLLPGLDTDQVHAVPPADVPPSDPVHLEVLGEVVLPGEEVVVALVLGVLDPVGAVPGVGQTEGPSAVTTQTLALPPCTAGQAKHGEEEIFHLKTPGELLGLFCLLS